MHLSLNTSVANLFSFSSVFQNTGKADNRPPVYKRIWSAIKQIFAHIVYYFFCSRVDLRTKYPLLTNKPGFFSLTSLPVKLEDFEKKIAAALKQQQHPLRKVTYDKFLSSSKTDKAEARLTSLSIDAAAKEISYSLRNAFANGLRPIEWRVACNKIGEFTLEVFIQNSISTKNFDFKSRLDSNNDKHVTVSNKWQDAEVRLTHPAKAVNCKMRTIVFSPLNFPSAIEELEKIKHEKEVARLQAEITEQEAKKVNPDVKEPARTEDEITTMTQAIETLEKESSALLKKQTRYSTLLEKTIQIRSAIEEHVKSNTQNIIGQNGILNDQEIATICQFFAEVSARLTKKDFSLFVHNKIDGTSKQKEGKPARLVILSNAKEEQPNFTPEQAEYLKQKVKDDLIGFTNLTLFEKNGASVLKRGERNISIKFHFNDPKFAPIPFTE